MLVSLLLPKVLTISVLTPTWLLFEGKLIVISSDYCVVATSFSDETPKIILFLVSPMSICFTFNNESPIMKVCFSKSQRLPFTQ